MSEMLVDVRGVGARTPSINKASLPKKELQIPGEMFSVTTTQSVTPVSAKTIVGALFLPVDLIVLVIGSMRLYLGIQFLAGPATRRELIGATGWSEEALCAQ
jgi:hypothetical protein